jgi:hypothetical protein
LLNQRIHMYTMGSNPISSVHMSRERSLVGRTHALHA